MGIAGNGKRDGSNIGETLYFSMFYDATLLLLLYLYPQFHNISKRKLVGIKVTPEPYGMRCRKKRGQGLFL